MFTQINLEMSPVDSNNFLELTSAISDRHRFSIICHLVSGKHMTLQQLAKEIGLSSSTTYHHLCHLINVKIVNSSRNGRSTYYSYNPTGFKNIVYSLEYIEKGGEIK